MVWLTKQWLFPYGSSWPYPLCECFIRIYLKCVLTFCHSQIGPLQIIHVSISKSLHYLSHFINEYIHSVNIWSVCAFSKVWAYAKQMNLHWMNQGKSVCIFQMFNFSILLLPATFATSLLPFEHTRANRSTQSFFVVFFSYSDSFFFATSFYLLSFIFFQSKQNGKQKTAARFVVGASRCKHEKCAHFNEFYYYFECIFCYLMFKIWLKILIEIRT